jgi:transmembrane 9 superfamily member 1
MEEEESGWKYVHGDVFRFPPNKSVFCAFVGTGSQLLCLSLCIFALALGGRFYPYNRGTLYSALIGLYAATSCIAGYVAASYYRQMGGELWVRNILLTCGVFCGPLWAVFAVLNTVAIAYRVSEWAWGQMGGWGLRESGSALHWQVAFPD